MARTGSKFIVLGLIVLQYRNIDVTTIIKIIGLMIVIIIIMIIINNDSNNNGNNNNYKIAIIYYLFRLQVYRPITTI